MTPNNEQLMSLLRTLLQIIGTAVVTHGTLGINGAMWEQISGGIIVLAPTIWMMFARTDKAAIATAAAIPDVTTITVKASATDGAAAAAADPTLTKVVQAS